MKKYLCIAMLALTVLAISGCQKEEVVEVPVTSEEIEIVIQSDIKSPIEMTQEEMLALNASEIKEMVETYLPNYKESYGIDEDRVMSDEDWYELRDFIYYQIYGEILEEESEVASEESSEEVVDPDWIYYAPTMSFLQSMSTAEFAEYMDALSVYSGVSSSDTKFTELDDEQLEVIRIRTIREMAVDYDGSLDGEDGTLEQLDSETEDSAAEVEEES